MKILFKFSLILSQHWFCSVGSCSMVTYHLNKHKYVSHWALMLIVECCYNMVQYNMIFHTILPWIWAEYKSVSNHKLHHITGPNGWTMRCFYEDLVYNWLYLHQIPHNLLLWGKIWLCNMLQQRFIRSWLTLTYSFCHIHYYHHGCLYGVWSNG